MWDGVWPALVAERDAVRLDLRGFGESSRRPRGALAPVDDVLDTLAALSIERGHLVGGSYGAGVAVEVALTRPDAVGSLLLCPPGGSLLGAVTASRRGYHDGQAAALSAGDHHAAVEANVSWWVDGPSRSADAVDPSVRDLVARMQRRAFELTADWDDLEEAELDPPALDRLGEIRAPTLVLVGALDLDAVHDAVRRLVEGIAGARRVEWPGTAHLPAIERPDDFLALLRDWLAPLEPTPRPAPREI
jgi:3-oxoadipate enol-lactonase